MRVPMRGTGADQLVVVMKSRNGDGAKGLDHPALPWVNQRWEEPIGKASSHNWWDDKSRMSRETSRPVP